MFNTSEKFSYIVGQSTGIQWYFLFEEGSRIDYRINKTGSWSEKHLLAKCSSSNYSVILLPDDRIQILYINTNGSIVLSELNSEQWILYELLKNENSHMYKIYFKAILHNYKTHIFYSVFNCESKTNTILHQILDESMNLLRPLVIDTIHCDYIVPFSLNCVDSSSINIIYEKYSSNYQIGYRTLNTEDETLSNFCKVDSNDKPFEERSIIYISNSYLHTKSDYSDLNFYQESLISKEKQLNEIEILLLEKENKIQLLEKEIYLLKNKSEVPSPPIKNIFLSTFIAYIKKLTLFFKTQ